MATFTGTVLLWLGICGFLSTAVNSFTIPTYRDVSRLQRRYSSTVVDAALGKTLYWYTNVTVGDGIAKLGIDTGSTNLILDPGYYKPSKHSKPYGPQKILPGGFEGINREGFGMDSFNATLYTDVVKIGSLSVPDQVLASVIKGTITYQDTKPLPEPIPLQGVIGFDSKKKSEIKGNGNSFIQNLHANGVIPSAHFGLAFGSSGTGSLVLGEFDESLADGPLQIVKNTGFPGYTAVGDVWLNGKLILKNQSLVLDVGTNNMQCPTGIAKNIFKELGYQTESFTSDGTTNVLGYFPCDKPPTLGFSFTNSTNLGAAATSKVFTIPLSVWDVDNNGNNNCTSILGGTSFLNPTPGTFFAGTSSWLIGQPFFASHYMDFDLTNGLIGIADLKNPSG